MNHNAEKTTRRDALRTAGRWTAAAVLGGVSLQLAWRSVTGDARCGRPNPCVSCGENKSCSRPEAIAWRNKGR